mmetsp:Transcript_8361/g.19738  ORF Transcript_8361/g.19738 Transcript_8361/m.19738 type:complete len:546 (-) Transcript_8361:147-1784(-)
MVDGVAEGEEGVRGDGHAVQAFQEGALLLCCQCFGRSVEVLEPLCALRFLHVALNVSHPSVHPVLPLHTLLEGEALDLRVEAQPPSCHLATCELHAVHAALLACTYADHHPVLAVTDGVGLRVLDGDGSQDQIFLRLVRDGLAAGDHLRQLRRIEERVVALLHEAHTADHAVLQVRMLEVRIGLQNDELAALLGLEHLQSLRDEAWGDDAVADLNLQNHRRREVHLRGDRDEVAKRAHRVGVACPDICGRGGRKLLVLDLIDDPLLVTKRNPDGGASRANVLEGRSRWKPGGLPELMHKLPSIDGVKQIDVSGRAADHLERQLLARDGAKSRRKLVRVAAILEGHLKLERDRLLRRGLGDLARHPSAHRRVVGGSEGVGGSCHVLSEGKSSAAGVVRHLLGELRILRWTGEDSHCRVVLRGGPDHRWTSDVDVLDAGGKIAALGHCLLEGVQVDHYEVDLADSVLLHLALVSGVAAGRQEASVNLRVQRLHSSIKDLRGASVVSHILDSAAKITEFGGCAARGEDVDALRSKELSQVLQTCLVED